MAVFSGHRRPDTHTTPTHTAHTVDSCQWALDGGRYRSWWVRLRPRGTHPAPLRGLSQRAPALRVTLQGTATVQETPGGYVPAQATRKDPDTH